MTSRAIAIVQPPANPVNTGTPKEWSDFLAMYGGVIAPDYVDFVKSFGYGALDDYLIFLNPFTENQNVNYITKGEVLRGSVKAMIDHGIRISNGLAQADFASDRIAPFAISIDGDIGFSVPRKNGIWEVGYYDRGDNMFYLFPMTFTDFFIGLANGTSGLRQFPEPPPGGQLLFDPPT
jgi:hypothetical protein